MEGGNRFNERIVGSHIRSICSKVRKGPVREILRGPERQVEHPLFPISSVIPRFGIGHIQSISLLFQPNLDQSDALSNGHLATSHC